MRHGGAFGGRSRVWGNTRNLACLKTGRRPPRLLPSMQLALLGKAAVAGGELVRDLLLARARPGLLRGKRDGVSV